MSEPRPARRALPIVIALAVALAIVVGVGAVLISLGGGDDVDRLDASRDNPAALPSGDAPPEDVPVPDVELDFWDGGASSLADLRGKPTVVNFWASWCAPCIAEMPDLEAAHQAFGDRVQFVGVNRADSRDLAEALAEQTGVTYPLATDPDDELLAAVGGLTMPTTLLIDENGVIVRVHSGAVSTGALTSAIEEELGTEPER
jgi:thiol-disulfide isomerase/thioredoxin